MVKLLRFMSADEYTTLSSGFAVKNDTNHHLNGNGTDSIGFCFAPISEADDAIFQTARYLSGVVNMEVCLVAHIDITDASEFVEGYGMYADHDTHTRRQVREYSATVYSLMDFNDYKFYTADMTLGPIVWSESWRMPELLEEGMNS